MQIFNVPHCSYDSQAQNVCSNPNCKFNPFICQNNCQCKRNHHLCDRFPWQSIKKQLQSCIIKNNPKYKTSFNEIALLYQNIIKYVTKAYEDFKQWKEYFGLTQKQSQFLKLIEEGRYHEITGFSIDSIRKQIKTPSKIIIKTQSEIKQKMLLTNTYAHILLLQLSEIYSKNKVEKINKQKKNIENINDNRIDQNSQPKISLLNRLLGLNEKGDKFLKNLNQNSIETKLQKLIQKTDSNEKAIMKALDLKIQKIIQIFKDQKKQITQAENETKKGINQFRNQINKQNSLIKTEISTIKNDAKLVNSEIIKEVSAFKNDVKILSNQIKTEFSSYKNQTKAHINEATKIQINQIKAETSLLKNDSKLQNCDVMKEFSSIKNDVKMQNKQIKTEITQLKNEIKQQINMKIIKEITQLRNQNKKGQQNIIYNGQIFKQQIIMKNKINNIRSKVASNIQLTFALGRKQLPFFPQSALKIQSAELLMKIEQKLSTIFQSNIKNNLSIETLHKQFNSIEKQAQLVRREFQLMINNIELLKINAISFMFTKKIEKLDLLYRASQNKFQASKFHNKCDGKKNTITILRTEFGNVIGGYTPLAWNRSLKSSYQTDKSNQSFIFSLTHKHKLKLIEGKQDKAIFHSNDGPVFGGGHDLYIADKANQNTISYSCAGYSYHNGEYIPGTQQSYKKLSGQSNGHNFKISQWQVYSVVFL